MISDPTHPKSIFCVVLGSPNEKVSERIQAYRNYPISDRSYLLSSSEISGEIAKVIGLQGDDRIDDALGIVFKLNGAYSGYFTKSVWEWLSNEEGG